MQNIKALLCRSYKSTDLESILSLFYDTVHAINIKDYSQEQINMWAPPVLDKVKWAKSLSEHFTYVVEMDDKIVGFCDMTHNGSLEHLYVDKGFQGHGIASLLLETVEKKAYGLGLADIVTVSSITAKPFFEKRGFMVMTEQEKIVSGVSFVTYVMKKKIHHFVFKKITEKDLPTLLAWFKEPHVEKWWPTPETDELFVKFLERIRSKDTFGYMVFLGDLPIGYIQYYYIDRTLEKAGSWLPPLPETTIGTDQFIGDLNYVDKGYGTQFIKQFIHELKTIEPNITTIIVDPDPENVAAIRCYEKVGFRSLGVYDAPWGPALLMRYDW